MNSNNLQQVPLVLVVDDDNRTRMQLRQAMEQAGYRVVEASNGQVALAVFTQLQPDIVLLDAVMPVMDGLTCCRQLQSLPGGSHTPVLMITRLEDQESVELAFDAGATDFITKPIHIAVLSQRVRILLSASRTMEELRQQKVEAETTKNQVINILESITDGFFALDNEWKFTYLNQQAEALLQRTRVELLGKNVWDEFPQAVRLVFYKQYHKAVSEQVAVKFEEFYPPLNAWFAVHAYPSKDGLSVYFQDITERKRLEAIAHTREQQITDFVENANVGMHWVGKDGQIIWANQAELDLLGYSREEYIGQPITKFHADAEVIEDILRRLQANETLYEYEARLLSKDGTIKHVLVNSNVFWQDQQFIHTRCFTRDVTERRRIEQELQQTTLLQRAILDSANYTIISTNVDGTILTFNAAAERLLGYSAAEIVGTTPVIIHDTEEVVRRAEELSQELGYKIEPGFEVFVAKARLGELDEREWTYIRKDGSRFPVLLSVTALQNAEGKITGFLSIGSDITQRKQTEAELRDLSAALSNAVEGISRLDTTGRYVHVNLAYASIMGYQPEEMIGMAWQQTVHSEDLSKVITAYQQMLSVGKVEVEAKGIFKDGSSFYKQLVMVKAYDEQKQFNGHYCFVKDITRRKQAEEELQRQNQRSQLFAEITLKIRRSLQIDKILQTTVTEVQKLLQADRVLLFRLYHNGYGQIVNEAVVPGCLSVLGQGITDECFGAEYLKKYIQGRIYTIDDIDKAGVEPCLAEFMRQFNVKAKLVMPILLKEELWGLLIAHQCNRPRSWTSFEIELLRPIADQIGIALAQAQMLEEEKIQREELARSNAELQQFASVASHDLQEPLRKIQAFGNRLKASCGEALTPQGLDYLERMQNAAGRMQTLIEDLLTFSRITTKALPFVQVNLMQLAQEVLSDLELQLAQTQGHVEVGDLPTIEAEPVQMRQLLQNLISNALKFHKHEQTPFVKVYSQLLDSEQQTVENHAIAQFCQIIVEDNGIGFDEKYLDRIFNVFQRLHSRSEYEGTGMGLAIVKKIAERHGGSITAESMQGQGSRFIVTLPVKQRRGDLE